MAARKGSGRSSKLDGPAADAAAFGRPLEDLIGYNLRRAHGVQKQRFAAVFGPHGIRPATLSALGTIFDHPGVKPAELGRRLHMQRANIVPLLAELESRALIARRTSDEDRRSQHVFLTAAGKRFAAQMFELHRRMEEDLARTLGARERDQLLHLLKKFRRLSPEPLLDG